MSYLQNLLSPNLCRNTTLLHGKIRKLKRVICMQTLHGKISRISLDRDSTPLQGLLPQYYRHRNPLDKNETHLRIETESISPTNLSNSEESMQNFEDTSSTQEQDMQDQDIVQEQIQERMEPENEINICKFYIKKCCRHGLRSNNCYYPHPAPCKKYIENPENGCRPECTNFHPDICKYSRKLRKCYNANCYRIQA